ncbi:MAG: hypothetical protein ACRERR_02035 [Moraxellaceae bacterium]
MREKLSKLKVAADMIVASHTEYCNAKCDMNYIKSILLSGAAIGILHPYLVEKGCIPSQSEFTNLLNSYNKMSGLAVVKESESIAFSRLVYNSLKHAGNPKKRIKATDDLEFIADLRGEAYQLLTDSVGDISKALSLGDISSLDVSLDLLTIIQSPFCLDD